MTSSTKKKITEIAKEKTAKIHNMIAGNIPKIICKANAKNLLVMKSIAIDMGIHKRTAQRLRIKIS
ncbi:hypothetical protein AP3564_12405 [Aeribacillus pallidus]|uniref:Uncharacterized protein n=1 Tax=Aeribacillus pallidus TaxID=33936 RepID=A0A223E6M9_9BACI|nr:hypothetical protein AP3564_12405 [Aeribacillus pallidus]